MSLHLFAGEGQRPTRDEYLIAIENRCIVHAVAQLSLAHRRSAFMIVLHDGRSLVAFYPSVSNHYSPIREAAYFPVMSHQHKGNVAAFVEFPEDVHDLAAGAGVEIACRFIRKNNTRIVDKGASDGDALLLPP